MEATEGKPRDMQEGSIEEEKTYLIFEMLGENIGLDVSKVLSIVIVPERITRVPNAPYYVRGVMNLRGTIIPVLDCSTKIGGPPSEIAQESRVVVAEIEGITFGVIVDAVREVRNVLKSQVETADSSATSDSLSIDYVSGVAKLDDGRLLVLLDLAKLFDLEELLEEEA